jgi:hypothetical protein
MKRHIALAITLAAGAFTFSTQAAGQIAPPPTDVKATVINQNGPNPILDFRRDTLKFRPSFEISYKGSPWARTQTVILDTTMCPPSTTQVCGFNSPRLLNIDDRWADVKSASPLSVLPTWPFGPWTARYYVQTITPVFPSLGICAGGTQVTQQIDPEKPLVIWLNGAGQLPVSCSWTVETAVYPDNLLTRRPFALVSDTVTVTLKR